MTEIYRNNPLHGLGLEQLLTELVEHYGWEILAAALNFNCFRLNPSIKGSHKFLKKTEWARHKLEDFYLYRFKSLPKPSRSQLDQAPRDRIIPEDQKPGTPEELTLENLAKEKAHKEQKAREFDQSKHRGKPRGTASRAPKRNASSGKSTASKPGANELDPWAAARKSLAEKKDN